MSRVAFSASVLLLISSALGSAQVSGTDSSLKLGTPTPTDGFRHIYITLMANDETLTDLRSKHSWSVLLGDVSNRTDTADVTLSDLSSNTLKLELSPHTPGFVPSSCVVILDMKTTAVCKVPGRAAATSKPAPKPVDPNKTIYRLSDYLWSVDGSYSPAIGSKAQYSLDSNGTISLLRCKASCAHSNYNNYFGGEYNFSMDKRNDVDPDSFTASLFYKRVISDHLKVILYPAGIEANRREPALNFASAGVATIPFRLYPPMASSKRLVANATISFGLEGGDNITNTVTGGGLGGFVRGLGGADLGAKLAPPDGIEIGQKKILKDIKVTSTYRLRIPAIPELYTVPIDSSTNNYFLSTKAHHYVKSELDFDFTDWLSLTIKHEHGALPPAFREIGQSVTIGLKATLDFSDGGSWLGAFASR